MKKLLLAACSVIAMHAVAQSRLCDSLALAFLRQDITVAHRLAKTLPAGTLQLFDEYSQSLLTDSAGQSVSYLTVEGDLVTLIETIGTFPVDVITRWERRDEGCPSAILPVSRSAFVRFRNK